MRNLLINFNIVLLDTWHEPLPACYRLLVLNPYCLVNVWIYSLIMWEHWNVSVSVLVLYLIHRSAAVSITFVCVMHVRV